MSRKLLLSTAIPAAAAAWTVAASTAFLWTTNSAWFGLLPGPFWDDPYFAHGLRWTWAWFTYATTPSMRASYGTELLYTAIGAAAVVGVMAFRIVQLMGNTIRPVYGKTEWADRKQMQRGGITAKRRPF